MIGCGCLKFACLQKVQPMYYEIVLDSLSVMLRQDSTVQEGSDILFCIPNIYLMTVLQRLYTTDDQELLCLCRWLYVCLSLWDQAHSVLWLVFIEKSHLWMLHLVYLNFLREKVIEKLLIHLFLCSILLSFRSFMDSSSFDWPTACTIADYSPYRTW